MIKKGRKKLEINLIFKMKYLCSNLVKHKLQNQNHFFHGTYKHDIYLMVKILI